MAEAAFVIPSLATDGVADVVTTKYGPITVTVVGDRSLTPCITFHDVGLNHSTCFQALLVAADTASLLVNNFCFYHIDCPGSQPGATGVPKDLLPITSHKLVDMVDEVVRHFQLQEFIGLGAGFGGYILAEYAARFPKSGMVGAILVSPPCQKASWTEWSYGKYVLAGIAIHNLPGYVVDQLIARLFSPSHRNWMGGGGSDLVCSFRRDISEMNAFGVGRYFSACLYREDLTPLLKEIKSHVLIATGDCSIYTNDTLHMNSVMDKSRTRFFEVERSGALCSEESPLELASAIQLFLRGLQGYGYGRPSWNLTLPSHK